MPNIVPANAQGLPDINRRRLLGNIAGLTAASAVAGATAATAATYEPPASDNLDALPISALWVRAIELAHDLSEILDRLNADGDATMVEIHAGESGHARVHFREALPNDARGMLAYYAACYRQTAQAIEPDVTEWSHVIYADAGVDCRFALIGNRKAVRS
ncbi:MAG: hypothetical protein M9955_19795 [Rhizobiaceae bacterium]|nr:hypothetical protein [Rhizobiaceae bacterium]